MSLPRKHHHLTYGHDVTFIHLSSGTCLLFTVRANFCLPSSLMVRTQWKMGKLSNEQGLPVRCKRISYFFFRCWKTLPHQTGLPSWEGTSSVANFQPPLLYLSRVDPTQVEGNGKSHTSTANIDVVLVRKPHTLAGRRLPKDTIHVRLW